MFLGWVDAPPVASVGLGSSAAAHRSARATITAAFERVFGRPPSLPEAQGAQVIGEIESSYGRGWSDTSLNCASGGCSDSNNWGAVIAVPCPGPDIKPASCPPDTFLWRDSFPDRTGCWQCFRRYPTPEAGAEHMIRVLYKPSSRALAAASAGDLHGMAAGMFDAGYFTGFGSTREEKIGWQVKRMQRALGEISKAMGEPIALGTVSGGARSGVATVFAVGVAGLMAYLTYPYWKGVIS